MVINVYQNNMLIPIEEYNTEVKEHINNIRNEIEPYEIELLEEPPIITLYLSRDFDLIHKDFGSMSEGINCSFRIS